MCFDLFSCKTKQISVFLLYVGSSLARLFVPIYYAVRGIVVGWFW